MSIDKQNQTILNKIAIWSGFYKVSKKSAFFIELPNKITYNKDNSGVFIRHCTLLCG